MSDKREPDVGNLVILLLIAVAMLIGLGASIAHPFGIAKGRDEMIRQAVDDGKAEYYLDDKHERRWRWK